MTQKKSIIAGTILLTAWLTAMAVAFWWFQLRPIRSFYPQDRAVFFDSRNYAQNLSALIPSKLHDKTYNHSPVVVHFYDPDCSCNKFNESHVKELIRLYGKNGVHFIIALKKSSAQKAALLRRAKQTFIHPAVIDYQFIDINQAPPSSPAVAVMETSGKLAYYGPYSIGAVCTVSNGAFVEKVLDSLLNGKNLSQLNTVAVGCFCPWDTKSTNSI